MGSPCFHEVNEGETEENDARRATISCSRAGRRPASEWTIEVEPRTRFGRMSRSRLRLDRPLGRATRGASSSSYPSNVRQATFRPKSAGRYNLLRSSSVDPVSPFVKGDSSTTTATQELEEEAGRTPSGPLRAIEQAIKNERPATNREPFACNFDRKDRHTRAARPIESRELTARIHLESRCRAKHVSRRFLNVRQGAVWM